MTAALTFPPHLRLAARADYQRVYRLGRGARHRTAVLYAAPSGLAPEACTRWGFTVSKKVSRRAVDRNRLRRVWREAVRLCQHRFRPGHDVVINARKIDPRSLSTPHACEILLELAESAGLLREGTA